MTDGDYKRQAAAKAVELVEDGMLLGLGSGSTSEWFVRLLGERVAAGLRVRGVATSGRTERAASAAGVPLVELDGPLDLAVDGADAIERGTLAAIKGHGGALTREKLVASAAARFVLIADDSKLVDRLTDAARIGIPIEVLPFGWQLARRRLAELGEPALRQRDGSPFITDNGNYVLDLVLPALGDPLAIAGKIRAVPGVVEHGLFLGMATSAFVAGASGVQELRRA